MKVIVEDQDYNKVKTFAKLYPIMCLKVKPKMSFKGGIDKHHSSTKGEILFNTHDSGISNQFNLGLIRILLKLWTITLIRKHWFVMYKYLLILFLTLYSC